MKSRDALLKSKAFAIGGSTTFKSNPIDTAAFFVDQHYRDFLNREPDEGGLNYWADLFSPCERTGDAAPCMSSVRVSVSAAFFIEQEFQQTGSFVYRMYKGSLGRQPAFAEFMPEREQVTGGANLEASKQRFADAWVQRAEFLQRYPQSLSAEQFVDALLKTVRDTSGVDLSVQRSGYLSTLQQGGRGAVVRQIIEEQAFQTAEYNRAFVLMQYFGYLRRDADDGGYKSGSTFWIIACRTIIARWSAPLSPPSNIARGSGSPDAASLSRRIHLQIAINTTRRLILTSSGALCLLDDFRNASREAFRG
ncbi:MAG: DUF4214 domain-containing protein [Pyrinomonadaceae bacterium]